MLFLARGFKIKQLFSEKIKTKFEDYVKSRTIPAQINEVLFKVLCNNIRAIVQEMYEPGIEANFSVEKVNEILDYSSKTSLLRAPLPRMLEPVYQ